MTDRITGRLQDGTAFVRSKTGNEGVGHFTTQRRLSEIISKLAELEDKIENGDLVEVKHSYWEELDFGVYRCHLCHRAPIADINDKWILTNYCPNPNCNAKMDF